MNASALRVVGPGCRGGGVACLALGLGLSAGACSAAPSTSKSPVSAMAVGQKAAAFRSEDGELTFPRTGTEVIVSRTPEVRPNLVCTEFCARLATCWYAVPGVDPTLSVNDVTRLCLEEEGNCEKPQKDRHCCGLIVDCHDFNTCVENSRNIASDCELDPGWKADTPETFSPLRK